MIESFPRSIDELLGLYHQGRISKETLQGTREFDFGGKTYVFRGDGEDTLMALVTRKDIPLRIGETKERVYYVLKEGRLERLYTMKITKD